MRYMAGPYHGYPRSDSEHSGTVGKLLSRVSGVMVFEVRVFALKIALISYI